MTMKTTAVVISEPGRVGLDEVSLRPLAAQELVVETAYTSISAGTERMLLAGQMPHPMLSLPVVPGYETVGQVVELGAEVDPAWLNRWVYVGGSHCYVGVNAAWGGQSARLLAQAERAVPLDGVDPRHGLMLALGATALHGINLLQPGPTDRLLILGQGPVGQLAARLARLRGAWVAVADRYESRLARAEADMVMLAGDDQPPLTELLADGVNAIIDATGSMAAITGALPLLQPKGTILLLGYYQNLELPYMPLFLKEARLLTAKEWAPGDLAAVRDLIAQEKLDVAPLLTHHLPISAVTQAYDTALNDADCLKLVIDWQERQSG